MRVYLYGYLSCLILVSACGFDSFNNTDKHRTGHNHCTESNTKICKTEDEISDLNAKISLLNNSNKYVESQYLQLKANHLTELKDCYTKETSYSSPSEYQNEINRINRKYTILRKVFKWEKKKHLSESQKSIGFHAQDDFDEPYPYPFASVYHPRVAAEVKKSFDDFGPLYINSTVDASGQVKAQEVKVKMPWSGYWYPFRDGALYNNKKAPLVIYDKLMRNLGYESEVAKKEWKTYGTYAADGWEGLCLPWALASVLTDEPTQAIELMGISFSVPAQKALLTFSHSMYPFKQYGITYRGDADTDGTYQDLKPEAFHRIVTKVLRDEKRALIVDDTAGPEVWNKPLYKYRWIVKPDPNLDDAFLVKSFPGLVHQRNEESASATTAEDTISPIYHYRLYVDKNDVKDGSYRVIAGQWIKDSRKYHPGNIKYPENRGAIKSHNSAFNENISIYKKLFLDH